METSKIARVFYVQKFLGTLWGYNYLTVDSPWYRQTAKNSHRIGSQVQPEPIRSITGATQRERQRTFANIGPNLFHQTRTVLWLISMPRSCKRSSTLRSESGKRTYSIAARRMISGLVLKYLNGECFVIRRGYETTRPVSS